jgi:hypothetical protein
MASWSEFAGAAPDFAAAGRRLLVGADGVAIGFLATARAGTLHLSPVCPIFCGEHLYLIASARTPKVRDLRAGGGFVLHTFLGEADEELQVAGSPFGVVDPVERSAVHEVVPYPSFRRDDPIFRLLVERALWVHWEGLGTSDARAVRRRWPVGARGQR